MLRKPTYDRTKRALDVLVSAAGLVVTLPLQGAVAAAVLVAHGRPVIFRQPRPGLNGEVFTMLKFRTMAPIDPSRNQVTNEERTTRLGTLLRSTSLDELPSLWNVLRGEMSLVGPRPLRTNYLPRYSRVHSARHSVRPGLTGLAQVSGRNSLDWNSKLDLDVKYVEERSWTLDLRILLRTISSVVRRTGINGEGAATMSEFMGSGEPVHCRPLERRDLPTRVEWLNEPSIRRGISISFTADLSEMERWFERANMDTTRADYICVLEDGAPIAMFGLVNVSSTADLYLYVSPGSHGRGYGRLAMVHLLKEARRLGVCELKLEVKAENQRAIRLYERFGFKFEALLEDGGKWLMVLETLEA